MESMQDFVTQLFERKGITEDPEIVFEAMSEILHEAADRLEKSEPHAVHSIAKMREMASDIGYYDQFCESNNGE